MTNFSEMAWREIRQRDREELERQVLEYFNAKQPYDELALKEAVARCSTEKLQYILKAMREKEGTK